MRCAPLLLLLALACGQGESAGRTAPSPSSTAQLESATGATKGVSVEPTGVPTSRVPNEIEVFVQQALGKMDLTGSSQEHVIFDTFLHVPWPRGSVLVHAYVGDSAETSGHRESAESIDGVHVTYVANEVFGLLGRFTCDGRRFDVSEAHEDGSPTHSKSTARIHDFIKEFAPHACSGEPVASPSGG